MEYITNRNHLPQIRNSIQPVFDFTKDDLSSQIYEKCFAEINLEQQELEPGFLRQFLTEDALKRLCNTFLCFLEEHENEKYLSLKHGESFELGEVLSSFSTALKENFRKYGCIFQINKNRKNELQEGVHFLKKYLESAYFMAFCDGLELSNKERAFLLLNMANKQWGWLFPNYKSEEYKANLFIEIADITTKDKTSLTRTLNNKFICLGLFSEPWNLKDYVFSYFCGGYPSFKLERCNTDSDQDIYDYEEISKLNEHTVSIMTSELHEYIDKGEGCFMLLSSKNNYRTMNYLNYLCREQSAKPLTIYEFNQKIVDTTKQELEFYLYAESIELQNKNSIILIGKENSIQIVSFKNSALPVSNYSLFSKIKVPVIISIEHIEKDTKANLCERGINVLYSAELKLPERKDIEKIYHYFFKKRIPEKFYRAAIIECIGGEIAPEFWPEVVSVLHNATSLTIEQAKELLENKFVDKAKLSNVRKNSHYCLDALNTTEPIKEITQAIKNAEQFQHGEYDDESGIRTLLKGPSGTGKTAYVEEVAKILNKPLKIIRASDILGSYVGETEQNIKNTFEEAASEKAILLIDEADSFLHSRGDTINRHNDSKVNEFLVQMERYPGILFCNTNLPENLDKATDRRFHLKVGFKPLTKEGVSLLCESYFSRFEITPEQITQIYNSGDVTPGDFGALNGRIRFLDFDKLNSEFITKELCKIVTEKERSWEKKTIGFAS